MPKLKPKEVERLYVPREGEILGIVDQMFGFDRVRVRCRDGRIRNCRIPGKHRKRLWVREGDVVVVKPWPVQGDERGDIVFRYTPTQTGLLKQKAIWE